MKIGLVTPYALDKRGGVNRHIEGLAQYLVDNGHDIRIIGPASDGYAHDSKEIIVDEHPYRWAAGGSWAYVSIHSLFKRKGVRSVLREEDFDVLHVHEPFMPFLPIVAIGESNIPNVATFHAAKDKGNRWYQIFRNMPGTRGWMERTMERSDAKICVSPLAKRLIARYFPEEDYRVIPNFINIERFSSAEPLKGFNDGKSNILYVGRLEKRKGVSYLLHAYGNIAHDFDARLIIVSSSGNLKPLCDQIIATRGLKNVVFANNVSNENLPRYYKTADVVCAPSTGNESFGFVLIEAMAAGKPVIASRIPGYEDVIKGGEGILVKPKDVDELTQALYQLLENENLRYRMGGIALNTSRQYSTQVVGKEIEKVYNELLK